MDDLKISHGKPNVVTKVIKQLEAAFGIEVPLTKTHGKVLEYLGMILDFTTPGKVMVLMKDFIERMLNKLPTEMDGEAVTAAANHLFEVSETDPINLNEEQCAMLHHNVAKLLFLCKRARPNIQTAVAFLCTRGKAPNTDDSKKLTWVMRYLRGTVNMPLTLEAESMQIICSSPRHEKSHRSCDDPRKRRNIWHINQAKN